MNDFWQNYGLYSWLNNSWNAATDINRSLETQYNHMNEIYDYNWRQATTVIKKTFTNKRDPARPKTNRYL